MLSLTSPLIVVLIFLGKLKPENCCEKGEFEVETLLSFLPHYFCYIANSRKQKTGFLTESYIKPAYQNSESSSINYRKATQLSTFQ